MLLYFLVSLESTTTQSTTTQSTTTKHKPASEISVSDIGEIAFLLVCSDDQSLLRE